MTININMAKKMFCVVGLYMLGVLSVSAQPEIKIEGSPSSKNHPLSLAIDTQKATFWVSKYPPTESKPQHLSLTFAETFDSSSVISIVGRKGYGPKKVELKVSDGSEQWKSVSTFTMKDGEVYTIDKIPPTTKKATFFFYSAYDRAPNARNVQVAEVWKRKPLPILPPIDATQELSTTRADGKKSGLVFQDPPVDMKKYHRLRQETLTSSEAVELYLKILENFVPLAEARWEENNTFEPNGGRFKANGAGVDWARGNGDIAVAYAVLLKGRPHQKFFSDKKIPRAHLEDHLVRSCRFVALAYDPNYKYNCGRGTAWGPGWQVSLDFAWTVWASLLQEQLFDQKTLELVRTVATAAADTLDKKIPSSRFHNTGSEDCTWNTSLLSIVANRYADDPRSKKWDMLAKKWAMNTLSRDTDKTDTTLLDGRPVNEWVVSENTHPDLSIENHNMWSTGYQIQCEFFTECMMAYAFYGNKIPEVYSWHQDEMWENVTKSLYLYDGDMLSPTGQDWAWKSYNDTEYLTMMRLFFNKPEAGAFESHATQMAYRRQMSIGTGGFGTIDFGFSTVFPKRLAFACLAHMLHPEKPGKEIDIEKAHPKTEGGFLFPHVRVGIHRTSEKYVSVSWHNKRQPIYIIPAGEETFTNPLFFFPYDNQSGCATVSIPTSAHSRRSVTFNKTELLRSHTKNGMQIDYIRSSPDGVKQFVGIHSFPNETTLYFTAFKMTKRNTCEIGRLFNFKTKSIEGFPLQRTIVVGAKWLNISDRIGFASTEPLPAELPNGEYYAADKRVFDVAAQEWFFPVAVAVYTPQKATDTAVMANKISITDLGDSKYAVSIQSNDGEEKVIFDLKADTNIDPSSAKLRQENTPTVASQDTK